MSIFGVLLGFFAFSGAITAIPTHVSAPTAPKESTYSVAMTGYNAVSAQTDGDPFITASGSFSNPEVVVARSQDLAKELPFGTIIKIDGPTSPQKNCGFTVVSDSIGYRVIADTMNKKFTDRVDVLFPMASTRLQNRAVVLGVCDKVTIHVVGRINIKNPANLPKSQSALVAFVNKLNSSTTPSTTRVSDIALAKKL